MSCTVGHRELTTVSKLSIRFLVLRFSQGVLGSMRKVKSIHFLLAHSSGVAGNSICASISPYMLGNPEGTYGELVATRSVPQVGNTMVLPQHSGGNEKTVGVFESFNRTGGFCTVKGIRADLSGWANDSQLYYTCDMEGGASGSPVIGRQQSNQVIGINHVEYIGCPGGNFVNYATHMDRICDDAGSLLNCN